MFGGMTFGYLFSGKCRETGGGVSFRVIRRNEEGSGESNVDRGKYQGSQKVRCYLAAV